MYNMAWLKYFYHTITQIDHKLITLINLFVFLNYMYMCI